MVAAALRPEEVDVGAVLEAADRNPVLLAQLGSWFDPVRLDSDTARRHRERADRKRASTAAPPGSPDMGQEIESHLQRAEAGDPQGWWGLNYVLLFDEYGRDTDTSQLEADLRRLPGWQRGDAGFHDRMLGAAKRYVLDADPQPDEWFGTNTIWQPAFAGYRALRLIGALEPSWLDDRSSETWIRWAPIIVGYPVNEQHDGIDENILRHAMSAATTALAAWLVRQVDADNLKSGSLFFLWRLPEVLAPEIVAPLAAKAEDAALQPTVRRELLEFVLAHDRDRGVQLAVQLMSSAQNSEDEGTYALSVLAAGTGLRLALADTWHVVRPLIEADPAVGRDIFEEVVRHERWVPGGHLDDNELTELLTTLFDLFPPADDPPLQAGASFSSSREQLGRLRDRILGMLAERGTDAAVAVIERLRADHPDDHALRFRLRDARDARRMRWPSPSPGDIVALAHNSDARIVSNSSHLQQLIIASLRRAQRALQGTPRRAAELWNQKPLTPKDEGALSDWLQGWLNDDLRLGGRLIGRELQVRPSASGLGRGESVDLQVSAASGEYVEEAETVTVRIEVKGSWNRDVDTAMDQQLAGRYLQPTGLDHGIFLVGLFDAKDWADGDRRRAVCRRMDLADARERFERQADEISARRGVNVEAVVLDVRLP